MIYLFTALYCEAEPMIHRLTLEKDNNMTEFQVFTNENTILTVTGTGMTDCAVATGCIATQYPPKETDLFVNIGTCGAPESIARGTILYGNCIYNQTTQFAYYPDLLFRHTFQEATIITCAVPYNGEQSFETNNECVYDMEAASLYRAASFFFAPHQMIFLKVVSDHGVCHQNTYSFKAADITELIENKADQILPFIQEAEQELLQYTEKDSYEFPEELYERLVVSLHCSNAMEMQLKQYLIYGALSGISLCRPVEAMFQKGELPCLDRREGKKRLEQLKKEWISNDE